MATVSRRDFCETLVWHRACRSRNPRPSKGWRYNWPGDPYEIIVWRGSVSCREARWLIKATGEGKGRWHETRDIAGIYTSFPGGWRCALATGGDYGCWRGRRIGASGHADEVDGIQLEQLASSFQPYTPL